MTAPLSHDRLLATLSERLGSRHVRTDPADLAPHLVESRGLYRGHALAVVAPGIAEALFATAIGLFAAIPALIAYNRLQADVAKAQGRLEAFADEFSAILSRQIDERMAA